MRRSELCVLHWLALAELADRIGSMRTTAKSRSEQGAKVEADRVVALAESVVERRQIMREMMPHVASMVDAFRRFDPTVRVLMAEENGRRVVAKGFVDDCKRKG